MSNKGIIIRENEECSNSFGILKSDNRSESDQTTIEQTWVIAKELQEVTKDPQPAMPPMKNLDTSPKPLDTNIGPINQSKDSDDLGNSKMEVL